LCLEGFVAMVDGFEEFDISADGASVHGVRGAVVRPAASARTAHPRPWTTSKNEADRGNGKISCPVLFLLSQRGSVAKLYDDPLAIWQAWADEVRGGPVPVGHFVPEEAPEETTRQLLNFLQ
jgi:pimeloyl-ACP methyl ester carboxylesterase